MTTISDVQRAAPEGLTQADLDRFREVQRLAYRSAEAVAAELKPGTTEKEAARSMRAWLADGGVHDWFHVPFAWFGDRTAFYGFRTPFQFFPTDRRLEEGMPYILDVAPIVDGYTGDIGYAGRLGENAAHERLLDDLAEHRALILERVRARDTLSDVYAAVTDLARRQGYENRHRQYPGAVIAHRIERRRPARREPRIVGGFGAPSLRALARSALLARRRGWSPLWAGGAASDHPPVPGLWALEPHLGLRGVGAKFEELLVITDDDAYWLDEDLPHVRRWAGR